MRKRDWSGGAENWYEGTKKNHWKRCALSHVEEGLRNGGVIFEGRKTTIVSCSSQIDHVLVRHSRALRRNATNVGISTFFRRSLWALKEFAERQARLIRRKARLARLEQTRLRRFFWAPP